MPLRFLRTTANGRWQTVVGGNAWVIHRNKDIYGNDADQFRPERWIEKKNGDMRKSHGVEKPASHPTNANSRPTEGYFFAFGMGARTCIGRSKFVNVGLRAATNNAKPRH